jgi:hypothetical protein
MCNGLPAIRYYGCCVVDLYQGCRTHLSLEKDSPVSRSVEPPARGHVIEIPQVGALHHLYTRKAA